MGREGGGRGDRASRGPLPPPPGPAPPTLLVCCVGCAIDFRIISEPFFLEEKEEEEAEEAWPSS